VPAGRDPADAADVIHSTTSVSSGQLADPLATDTHQRGFEMIDRAYRPGYHRQVPECFSSNRERFVDLMVATATRCFTLPTAGRELRE